MNNETVIINPTCNNISVISDLSTAYNESMKIPFQPNISAYFYSIFEMLNEKMKNSNFLKNAECLSTYKLFEKILRDSGNFTFDENLSERVIYTGGRGYVYQMKVFSLFASYHFLTVVFDNLMAYVDIYQSYGSTMRLNHRRISIRDFEKCISILTTIKRNGKNFFRDANNMLIVERVLYGVNLSDYIKILYEHFHQVNNEDDVNFSYTPEEISQYRALGINDMLFGENLKTAYELDVPVISINVYIPKTLKGGKTKHKKRKNKKSLKKRKRTGRRH